ncbi:MAG: coenzyme F420-0:L-glutamate ligase, partial [Thermoplasmata archaeon]|nr:coenzyme F420-0:L-glutamate ligase [Thermoplasmata archaeon]
MTDTSVRWTRKVVTRPWRGLVLADGDVLVVAQKIVSKAEDRVVDVATVEPSERAIALAAEVEKDPRLV